MSSDLPPIRCVTCNTVLAHRWNDYNNLVNSGMSIENALNSVGLHRICCRIRLMNPFKYVEKVSNDSVLYEIHDKSSNPDNINTNKTIIDVNDKGKEEEDELDVPVVSILPVKKTTVKTKIYSAW